MVQKQDGSQFVWFSNGPDQWKTKFLASVDYFVLKQYMKAAHRGLQESVRTENCVNNLGTD